MRKLVDPILERRSRAAPERELDPVLATALVKSYGDFALAHKTVDAEELHTFGDSGGYIAYAQKMGATLALGDPVAPGGEAERLIDEFIGAFGKPAFVQVSGGTAGILAQRGWHLTPLGVDTVLDLATYDFTGGEKEGLRQSANWIRRKGFTVTERNFGSDAKAMMADISKDWRADRPAARREMRFLNRAATSLETPDSRYFFLDDPSGEPVAFIVFDPLWRDGTPAGYVTAIKRRRQRAAAGHAEIGTMVHAIEKFKAEGRRMLRLGLSPLAVEDSEARSGSLVVAATFCFARRSGWANRNIFNTSGNVAFKRRFRGREEPLFLGTAPGRGLLDLIATLRLSRLI
jgi:lysylphosphatidylglycerol synthetase-like protein (DUF2156 family)